ncbi:MAG: glycosyltransferase [Solirubrobacteraceae bacterium]|nr:glycosyltransferase [Patulibacter sp.]
MSPRARTEATGVRVGRRSVDVLYVSLGTTIGLRAADDQFVAALRAAGRTVEVVRPETPREVRTLMCTDFFQARAAARAVREELRRVDAHRIIYSTTTAAMFWPRPGAIRFDALAQVTRPGHHGLWQRPLERRRLRDAPLLVPCAPSSLDGAPQALGARRPVVVPIAISDPAEAPQGAVDQLLASLGEGTRAAAVTYAADAQKKGLDRVLAAWAVARKPGEVLLVTGRRELPEGFGPTDGVHVTGRLDPGVYRALVRAVGVLVLAPRREDYGLVQLEALGEGARVVTTTAPGPYAALPLIRDLWPEQVVDEADDPAALGAALRHAIDARPDADDLIRATAAVAAWRPAAVRETVERELLPALDGGSAG